MHQKDIKRLEFTLCLMLSDRIFTTKLGLSQSLIVQGGMPNLNLTLKGYPKKFCGLFGQKANKTQQITQFYHHRHSSQTYSQCTSHILHMDVWVCAINATLQLVRVCKIQSHFVSGSHWNISINFITFPTIVSPHTIHSICFWNCISLSPQKWMVM